MDYFKSRSYLRVVAMSDSFADGRNRAIQSIVDRNIRRRPIQPRIPGFAKDPEDNKVVESIAVRYFMPNRAVELTVPSSDMGPTASGSNLKPSIACENVQPSPAISAQKIPFVGAKKRGRPPKKAKKYVRVIVPTKSSGSSLKPSIAGGNVQTSPAITIQQTSTVGAKTRGRPPKNAKKDIPVIVPTEASGSDLKPSIACGNVQPSPAITAQQTPTVEGEMRGRPPKNAKKDVPVIAPTEPRKSKADIVSKWRGELVPSNSKRAQMIKKRISELKRAAENALLEKTKIETA